MHATPLRICVVTPIANEAGTISPFIDAVWKHLSNDDEMLLIIDNVTTDNTREVLAEHFERNPNQRVTLVEAPENRCMADAFVRGYREAVARRPKWILEIDAGFSHDPEKIPEFIEALSEGCDYASASRFLPDSVYRAGIYRRLLSQGGSWVARILLRCKITDMTGGFQSYRRETLEYVLERGLFSKGGFFQTEIKSMVSPMKWREIPIDYGNTTETIPFRYVIDGVKGIFRLAWRQWTTPKPKPKLPVSNAAS
jgi:dolichol-phosphate mannosyltransferase